MTSGEPLMTLPDSALRHAERKREEAARAEPPAWMQKLKPAEIDTILALFPRCAQCGRPVDKLAWTADPATPAILTFTVWCHGAEESTDVPREIALRGGMVGDVAFATAAPKLPGEGLP